MKKESMKLFEKILRLSKADRKLDRKISELNEKKHLLALDLRDTRLLWHQARRKEFSNKN